MRLNPLQETLDGSYNQALSHRLLQEVPHLGMRRGKPLRCKRKGGHLDGRNGVQDTITNIITGGQTGADRGGLDAAIHCDLPHSGWCPRGRKAEDGIIPAEYHLTEMLTPAYLLRTQANVIDSDATVIFTYGPLAGGSLKTVTYAHHLEKPYHDVDLLRTTR